MTSSHIHSHLFITAIILTLIIAILLLGIFILLAIFTTKKLPQMRYMRKRVINGSLRESGIIHLWPNTTDPAQASQAPDKQLLNVGVGNGNNLLNYDSLRINDTLEDKLLASSPPND